MGIQATVFYGSTWSEKFPIPNASISAASPIGVACPSPCRFGGGYGPWLNGTTVAVPWYLRLGCFAGPDRIIVGGRSRGGRMCSIAAADGHIRSRSCEYGRGNGNSLPR